MNVLFVSECGKAALAETRRILDQFAERKGERTWSTSITQQGLNTVRSLLRKSARKNTAVACHWIKSGSRSELVWIVGSVRAFNHLGAVPTNVTTRNILRKSDEDTWINGEGIALLAAIAGLFHDFGKANELFQQKLIGKRIKKQEPCRHEWVSLRLFQAFVQGEDDRQWIQRLLIGDSKRHEKALLSKLQRDRRPKCPPHPFSLKSPLEGDYLPLQGPIARAVGWLIVSHHRLLSFPGGDQGDPELETIEQWLSIAKPIRISWNSGQFDKSDWGKEDLEMVWSFPKGTPFMSQKWLERAQRIAKRAIGCQYFFNRDWLTERFSLHLARLSLMFADHFYSGDSANSKLQDTSYCIFANTDRKTKQLKQRLDEHCIGVSKNAFLCAKSLSRLKDDLPTISRHKGFRQRSRNTQFKWQDKAFDLTTALSRSSAIHGFFGINMASTGCGKTLANARIMGGISGEGGCRFTVALGLRTLTLQTGKALRERLTLAEDDLAVVIGSSAVQELDEHFSKEHQSKLDEANELISEGSESTESLFPEHQYVRYDGRLYSGRLEAWFNRSEKLHSLVSAPVVVCTIDQLMPATESLRGGHQIAPMLRLLTSDLVLDEADDFSIEDLPALSRLVNWAGMLGSRVLLSSATLPQSLISGLFKSYQEGWRAFRSAVKQEARHDGILCAWFDEQLNPVSVISQDEESFLQAHSRFIQDRIACLKEDSQLRKAEILPISVMSTVKESAAYSMAQLILEGVYQLHADHHQVNPITHQRISIGLVRFANIDPLVKVVREIVRESARRESSIFFCVYHSQFPIVVRSSVEASLDRILMRKDADTIWSHPEVSSSLQKSRNQDVIFIVFASPVAEIGRDHDYDWAVVEPSSLRSIIQLAGRVQRHRRITPSKTNIFLLEKNFKALQKGEGPVFLRPGPEERGSIEFRLRSQSLREVLLPEQYSVISSIPRIGSRPDVSPRDNLGVLEDERIVTLFKKDYVTAWWNQNGALYGELQRRTKFRRSAPDEAFCFYSEDESDPVELYRTLARGEMQKVEQRFLNRTKMTYGEGVGPWFDGELDVHKQLALLAHDFGMPFGAVCRRFGEIRLRRKEGPIDNVWGYDPVIGFYTQEEDSEY